MQCNMFKRQHVSNKKKIIAECFKHAKFRIKHHLLSSLIVFTAVLAVCHGEYFNNAATAEITTAATETITAPVENSGNEFYDYGKYYLYTEPRGFDEAKEACISNNLTIAMPKTKQEMHCLVAFLRKFRTVNGWFHTWIGLRKERRHDGYIYTIWDDGTDLNYTHWSNSAKQTKRCTHLQTTPDFGENIFGEWSGSCCKNQYHFVCENDLENGCDTVPLGYTYHNTSTTKAEAQKDCESRGQTLMKPMCQAQVDRIKEMFQDRVPKTFLGAQLYTGHTVDSVPDDLLWYKGQPLDSECVGPCDCVGLNLDSSWKFNDFECGVHSYKAQYVCEGINVPKCVPPRETCISNCPPGYACEEDGICRKTNSSDTRCDRQSECCRCISRECSYSTSDIAEIQCSGETPYRCNNRGDPTCISMDDLCVGSKTGCPDEDAKQRCSEKEQTFTYCRQGWEIMQHGDYCYKYIMTAKNQSEAVQTCANIGGMLANPNKEFIWEVAHNNGHCYTDPLWSTFQIDENGDIRWSGHNSFDPQDCFTIDHTYGLCI